MESIKNALNSITGSSTTNDAAAVNGGVPPSSTTTTTGTTTGSGSTAGTSTGTTASAPQKFKEDIEENVDANTNIDQHKSHWDYDSSGNKWPSSTGAEQTKMTQLTQSNTTGLDDLSADERNRLNEDARIHGTGNSFLSDINRQPSTTGASTTSNNSSNVQPTTAGSASSNLLDSNSKASHFTSSTGSSSSGADTGKAAADSSEDSSSGAASGGALTGAATSAARSGKDDNAQDPNSGANSAANRATGSGDEVKSDAEKKAEEKKDDLFEVPDDAHQSYGSALKNKDGSTKELADMKDGSEDNANDEAAAEAGITGGQLKEAHQGLDVYRDALAADAKALANAIPMDHSTKSKHVNDTPALNEH